MPRPRGHARELVVSVRMTPHRFRVERRDGSRDTLTFYAKTAAEARKMATHYVTKMGASFVPEGDDGPGGVPRFVEDADMADLARRVTEEVARRGARQ